MLLILLMAAGCVTAHEGGSQGLICMASPLPTLRVLNCPALQGQPTRSNEHQSLQRMQPACSPGSGQMPPALRLLVWLGVWVDACRGDGYSALLDRLPDCGIGRDFATSCGQTMT